VARCARPDDRTHAAKASDGIAGEFAFLTLCSAARCVVAKDAGEGASG
jgi:hypothetical protein